MLLGLLPAGVILTACGGGSEPNRAPSAIVLVSGNNQTGQAGQQLGLPLTVQVNDKSGDPVKEVAVTFAVAAGGGTVQTANATTNTQGRATTNWTVGTSVGATNTVTATATGLSGSPVTFSATVEAAPAASAVVLQGNSQTGTVGQQLPLQIQVEFRDAFNNPASSQTVTWTPAGGGSITQTALQTDAQGIAAADWTLGFELGNGQALTAQVASAVANISATANLGAGTTLAVFSGNNQTGLAGQALGAPVAVRVQTSTGKNIAKVPIDWNVVTGGGSVAQPSTLTNTFGVATTTWTLGAGGGAQSVSATNANLTPNSVTLDATAVIPPPSSITGTVTLVDIPIAAIRASSRAGRLSGSPPGEVASREGLRTTRSRVIRYVPGELLVRYKASAIGAPTGARALASLASAQSVYQSMMSRLAAHAVPGKVTIAGVSPVIRWARLKLGPQVPLDSVARALAADPAVAAVAPNPVAWPIGGPAHPGTVPNDANYPDQSWHYSMLDLPRAWDITTGSSGVIVAVLDNGIVFHHPDVGAAGATFLTGGGNLRNDGYDFVSSVAVSLCASQGGGTIDNTGDPDGYDNDPSIPDDRDASDPSGCLGARESLGAHGTHVAGTIGALSNNSSDVTGVNWNVSIRPVRVLGMAFGSFFDIANGILYAAGFAASGPGGIIPAPAQAAKVINMSFGGDCPIGPDPIHDAVQTVAPTTLLIAAAGNDAASTPSCPASYDEVLSVAAVGPTGLRASYSNFGSTVDLAAPGGEFGSGTDGGTFGILSTVCDFTAFPSPCVPDLAYYEGTSMAAPHVSGVAALLLAADPSLTVSQLRSRLTGFASPVDPTQQIGAGIVNARNALTQTEAPSRQILVRAINAATGATVQTVAAPGGNYTLSSLPDGNYFVVAGEDEAADGIIGFPGRRFGAFGGFVNPTQVAVSAAAGGFASFSVGFAAELEPNDAGASANRLVVDGTIQGHLDAADPSDFYRIQIPTAGTYSFESTGFSGAFCGFALELNTVVTLLDQNQVQLATSDDINRPGRNFCSLVTANLNPGQYFVRVTRGNFFGTGLHQGRYMLHARSGP
jgi:serine protease